MTDYINPRQIAFIEQSDREARLHLSSGSILKLNSDNETIANLVQTLVAAAANGFEFVRLPEVRCISFLLPAATPQNQ